MIPPMIGSTDGSHFVSHSVSKPSAPAIAIIHRINPAIAPMVRIDRSMMSGPLAPSHQAQPGEAEAEDCEIGRLTCLNHWWGARGIDRTTFGSGCQP